MKAFRSVISLCLLVSLCFCAFLSTAYAAESPINGSAIRLDIPSPVEGKTIRLDIPSPEEGNAVRLDIPSPVEGKAVRLDLSVS